jgi:hypothetical protein
MIFTAIIPAGSPLSHAVFIGEKCVTGINVQAVGPYGKLEIEAFLSLGEEHTTIRHECGDISLDVPNRSLYISLHPTITKPWPYVRLLMDQNQTSDAIFKLVVERV